MNMLNARPAEDYARPECTLEAGAEKAAMGNSIAVVPLTIPLLTGPAASLSTVVIYADPAPPSGSTAAGRLRGGGALAAAVLFSLRWPTRLPAYWARPGINVMTRLMGLILAALAVEVMADGLGSCSPFW